MAENDVPMVDLSVADLKEGHQNLKTSLGSSDE